MILQIDTARSLFEGYEKLGLVFLLLVAVMALIVFLLKLMKEHKKEREKTNQEWKEVIVQQHSEIKELMKGSTEAINNNTNIVSKLETLLQSIDRRVS